VFVDLSPVPDGADVGDAFLAALGATPRADGSTVDRLVESLGLRSVLLVVDNCEHVVDHVAALVLELVERTDRVRVLATSREALNVAGERILVLRPLTVPGEHDSPETQRASPAVDLYRERARAAGAAEDDSDDAIAWIATLCRRLDGVPLAIEFAAARARTLSPREIVDQLDAGRALAGARRAGGPAHHVTLDGAIEWSYRLLSIGERELLDALSTFAGWFDLAAASAVMGETRWRVADDLERLA
jgi:predicted ATPase